MTSSVVAALLIFVAAPSRPVWGRQASPDLAMGTAADSAPAPRQADKAGIQWVNISGGSFPMGIDAAGANKRSHQVLMRTFQLAKTLVTAGQYKACVDAGHCAVPSCAWPVKPGEEDFPLGCVSWTQAKIFSEWIGGRLPSESEWEYASRSGDQDWRHSWGAGYKTCHNLMTSGCGTRAEPVCSQPERNTAQGLCDMEGHLGEWVQDWYHPSFKDAPTDGSAWEYPVGTHRIFRGGSCYYDSGDARSAFRYLGPGGREPTHGFRPARDL